MEMIVWFITKSLVVSANKVLTILSPLVRVVEYFLFNITEDNAFQPVFIIGAPRTGSTILYQALTNAYQIGYIDNSACIWHRNLRFGLWISQKRYGDKSHNNFKAEHGSTSKFGGHAPSECGQFWYRWLPKEHHFVDHHEITPEMVAGVREEVLGAITYLKLPLLFKNLNAGQRLRFIHKAFPEAKIIFVRRDPRFVTRSILKARNRVGAKEGQWWSIMPPNVADLLTLPEEQMCAAQVYFIERQIEEDMTLFPKENIREIHCKDLTDTLIHELAGWIGVDRKPGKIPEFQHDDLHNLTAQEQEQLGKLVEKYPFKKELFI